MKNSKKKKIRKPSTCGLSKLAEEFLLILFGILAEKLLSLLFDSLK